MSSDLFCAGCFDLVSFCKALFFGPPVRLGEPNGAVDLLTTTFIDRLRDMAQNTIPSLVGRAISIAQMAGKIDW